MWTQSYSKIFKNLRKEAIWKQWTNINEWSKLNPGIEYAHMEGDFEVGNFLKLKPKGGPAVKIQLVEITQGKSFTDCTHFIGAKMYGKHEIVEEGDGLRLTVTMTVTGFLGFIWRKLVAENIIKTGPEYMERLVNLASKG